MLHGVCRGAAAYDKRAGSSQFCDSPLRGASRCSGGFGAFAQILHRPAAGCAIMREAWPGCGGASDAHGASRPYCLSLYCSERRLMPSRRAASSRLDVTWVNVCRISSFSASARVMSGRTVKDGVFWS